MTTFNDFGLSAPLTEALAGLGFTTPTPIQAQAIPIGMEGRDLLGIAQTGTGKTAAFALPILDRLARNPAPSPRHGTRVLVLAPTRELASQIADSFRDLSRHLKLRISVVVGGVPIGRQMKACATGLDILVATPGRLLDLIDERALVLSQVEVLVLDEADQMLDLGFIHALKRIASLAPARRQTMLFSATMPDSIADISKRYLRDPARVAVTPVASTVERVEQRMTFVNAGEKQALLTIHLRSPEVDRALIFTRTKHGADRVVRKLGASGIKAAAIHGNKSQPQRERALAAFRDGSMRILVATDIAARGIDVPGVSHVFNFEIPNVPEQYVHRIGRTARAGREGLAISFVADDERPYLRDIEKLTKQRVTAEPLPTGFNAEVAKVRALGEGEPERDEREDRYGRGASRGGRPQQQRRAEPRGRGDDRAAGPVGNPLRAGGPERASRYDPSDRPDRQDRDARPQPRRADGEVRRPEGQQPRREGEARRTEGQPRRDGAPRRAEGPARPAHAHPRGEGAPQRRAEGPGQRRPDGQGGRPARPQGRPGGNFRTGSRPEARG